MASTKLDDLLLFITIVEEGSMTLAAKKLNMPKSKLSRHLVNLEQQMTSQLLIRTTRKQQLTESGRLLYQASKPHIDALSLVEDDINALVSEPKGKLNLLFPLEFFNQIISELITDFAKLYPKICLSCRHYSGTLPDFDYQNDLTFVLHEGLLPESSWIAKTLLNFPQSIFAASEADVSHINQPEDLEKEKVILADSDDKQWGFRDKGNIQVIPVTGRIILSSPEMRLQATKRNLGLAKLPDYLCQVTDNKEDKDVAFDALTNEKRVLDKASSSLTYCGLQRVNLSKQPMAQQLSILYHSRSIPLKTRIFIDYFQSNIGRLT